jgi:hypothetical protein
MLVREIAISPQSCCFRRELEVQTDHDFVTGATDTKDCTTLATMSIVPLMCLGVCPALLGLSSEKVASSVKAIQSIIRSSKSGFTCLDLASSHG